MPPEGVNRIMSINAVYGFNAYLQQVLADKSLDAGEFYPGTFAPQQENANKFVLYLVDPGTNYDLYGLHEDRINYMFYNLDFDELQRCASVLLNNLHLQDIEDVNINEPGIHYQDVRANFSGGGQSSFVEGTDYFYLPLEVLIQYVEWSPELSYGADSLLID